MLAKRQTHKLMFYWNSIICNWFARTAAGQLWAHTSHFNDAKSLQASSLLSTLSNIDTNEIAN